MPNNKDEWLRFVLPFVASALMAFVSAAYAIGGYKADTQAAFRELEGRMESNYAAQAQNLSNAVQMRRAEQSSIITDLEATKSILRETLPVLKELSKGNSEAKEALARLEERVKYLAQGQDDIRVQINQIRKN